MRRPLHPASISLVLALSAPSVKAQGGRIDHQKFMGTWQIMTVKNLKTGEVDSIVKRRTAWTQYTSSNWTYVYMDTGRVGRSQAELAKLPPATRRTENYNKMWNAAGQWRFWGSGGTYWLDGDRMLYTNLISIEPYQFQLGGVERIIYLNDSAYAYQSTPDKDGVVREYTHKRLDHGAATVGFPSGQGVSQDARIVGNWQVMTRRNTRSGTVENVAQKRVNWFHVTQNHWTFVWMTKDRRNLTPDELARLPAVDQSRERYAKIWDSAGQAVFWASACTYHLDNGRFVVEPRVMSIEPSMIGVSGVEPITALDRDTYTYQSPADSAGVVFETTHRRIDW